MLTIYINGQTKTIKENTSLAELIRLIQTETNQEDDPKSIATAVNEEFVPRSARENYILKDGDHIMTFSPITGG